MKKIDPIFLYLTVLSVVQPARIQDIEAAASEILPGDSYTQMIQNDLFRSAHGSARDLGLITQVRKGVYIITSAARGIVRNSGLERELDNRRLFLMKAQRKRYK
jgi:hypothetical protein